MTFEHSWILVALILPLFLLSVLILKRPTGEMISFGKIQTRGELPRTRKKIFFSCGFLLLIVALARPQWGVRDEQVFDQSREVLIAVDLSRSMLATDLSPTRLDRAKIMIEGLLGPLKGERVGLLLFAGTAYLQSPLSPDYEIIREMIPTLTPEWMPQGGTDYTQMLKVASDAFASGQASDRFLIILSDGESTTQGWEEESDRLQKQGVKVLCLGLGTEAGTVVPSRGGGYTKDDRGAVVISKLEPKTLQEIAQRTGGVYRDSTQWVDLHALVQETVDRGKQGKFEEKRHEKKVERYQWFLGFSLLFFLLSFIYEMPVRLRARAMKIAALLFLWIGLGFQSIWAQTDPHALVKELARLSEQSRVKPQEWAGFAQQTIHFGEAAEVQTGIIETALAGVKKGEKEKPMETDWAKLREELESLLKKKKEQNKPNDSKDNKENKENKDQKNKEENKDPSQKKEGSSSQDNQSKGDQKDQNNSSGDQKQNNEPSDPQKGDQKENSAQSNPSNEQKSQTSPSGDKPENKEKKEPGQSGREGNQAPPKEPGGSQKVGGQQRDLDQMKIGKISKEERMQLNQVKQGDSPAKLFQVLEGKSKGPAKENQTKDW